LGFFLHSQVNRSLTIANLAAVRETLRLARATGLPAPAVLVIVPRVSGGTGQVLTGTRSPSSTPPSPTAGRGWST
jgi:3-hydroxyisobutyrate dehydrogenase-like beta-hydroxyacid dehydrogenase